jgi:hypothetical protein
MDMWMDRWMAVIDWIDHHHRLQIFFISIIMIIIIIVNYQRYISTYYVRRGIDFGSFKRDVLLFKTLALVQLFYHYLYPSVEQFVLDPISILMIIAGYTVSLMATNAIGIDRTYFGAELGMVMFDDRDDDDYDDDDGSVDDNFDCVMMMLMLIHGHDDDCHKAAVLLTTSLYLYCICNHHRCYRHLGLVESKWIDEFPYG